MQNSNIGLAVPISQMSQLPVSSRISVQEQPDSQQLRDISGSSGICSTSSGNLNNSSGNLNTSIVKGGNVLRTQNAFNNSK